MYTEYEIKRMEAALMVLHGSKQSAEGRFVRNALRGDRVNVRQLLNELENNLKLVGRNGDLWYLTSEGRTAEAIGLKEYLQKQERKAQEPKKMILMEKKFLGLSRSDWVTIAGVVVGLLGLLAGFLR